MATNGSSPAHLAPAYGAGSLVLPPQWFSANPLDRSLDSKRKFESPTDPDDPTEVCLVVVSGREVAVRPVAEGNEALAQGVEQELQVLLLAANDPQLDLTSDYMAFLWSETDEDDNAHRLPLYLLGQDALGRWTFALDISGPVKVGFMEFLSSSCGLDVNMEDLRSIMPTLSRDACAMAGHAAALSQWHLTHRFCNRCGGPTLPTEAGLRRKCERDHKLYPRTDPVVIMLVESPDGRRALLGRSRKFAPGMYTCLSGFIDQCESIEEAVRREVREEARVAVADVHIIGSQPWPIGRYGSCELMLGCMAKAMSYEIMVNTGEMEDVQWYDRSELAAAVALYDEIMAAGGSVQEVQDQCMESLGFFVPPPFAIAHHLIKLWAQHTGPWFPPVTPLPAGGLGAAAQQGVPPTTTAAPADVVKPAAAPAAPAADAVDAGPGSSHSVAQVSEVSTNSPDAGVAVSASTDNAARLKAASPTAASPKATSPKAASPKAVSPKAATTKAAGTGENGHLPRGKVADAVKKFTSNL